MTRKQKIATIAFASILLLSVISITYAFFTASVNDTTSDNVTVTSGSLSLTLNDMDVHSLTTWNITPSDLSRTVYLSVTNNSPISVDARLLFRGITNTYSGYLVYTVEEVTNGKTNLSPRNILENKSRVPSSASALNKTMVNRITLAANITKYYKVTIEYLYSTTVNQSSDVGKKFYTGFGLEENKDSLSLLADYIKTEVYGAEPTLYYHSAAATGNNETSIANWAYNDSGNADDGAYRYSGANASVKNYVCFNYTSASECTGANFATSDVAYRIISIDDDNSIKLIKALPLSQKRIWDNDSYTSTSFMSNKNEDYEVVSLATEPGGLNWQTADVKYYLNGTGSGFLSTISSLWRNKLLTNKTWYTAGNGCQNKVKISYYAEHEMCDNIPVTCQFGRKDTTTTVGLINIYDYGYGTSPTNWNTDSLSNYDNTTIKTNNWLYRSVNSSNEWTIGSSPYGAFNAIYLKSNGALTNLVNESNNSSNSYTIRPVFYLNSNTEFTGGAGTSTNPYIIKP